MSTDTRTETVFSLKPSELFDDEEEYRHLCRLFEKQFGTGLFGPSKKTVTFASKRSARRLSHLNPFRKTGYNEVYQNKSGIKFTLDVQQFKVSELSIKVVDQCVVIEGKHKDRKDFHGFIARSFSRKFFLPKRIDPSTLSAKLSLDGLLVVTAMSKDLPAPHVRVIDICCTRKRALPTNTTNTANKGASKSAKPSKKAKMNKIAKPKPQRSNFKPPSAAQEQPKQSGAATATQDSPKQSVGVAQEPPKQDVTQEPPKQSVGFAQEPLKKSGGVAQEPSKKSGGVAQEPSKKSGGVAQEPPKKSGIVIQEPPKKSGAVAQEPPKKSGAAAQEPPKKSGAAAQEPPKKSGAAAQEPPKKSGIVTQEPQKKSATQEPRKQSGKAQ